MSVGRFLVLLLAAPAVAMAVAGCGSSEGGVTDGGYLPDGSTGDAGGSDGGSKNEPEQSFFDPFTSKYFTLSFKGLINSYEDVAEGKAIEGIAEAMVTLPGGTPTLDSMPMSFLYDFPEDYPYAKWRGMKVVIADIYRTVKESNNSATYDDLKLYIPVSDLAAVKASGGNVLLLGDSALFYYSTIDVTARKDGTVLQRSCFNAVSDGSVSGSKLFVNHANNDTFAPGENLKAWANVALTDDKAKILATFTSLVDDGGSLCRYNIDGAYVAKDKYYEELEKEFDLECGVPEGFLTPFADSYLAFMFKGEINDLSSGAPAAEGVSQYAAAAAGKSLVVSDYTSYSAITTYLDMDWIGVVSIGAIEAVEKDYYKYNATETYISRSALIALGGSGANRLDFDPALLSSAIYRIDDKARDRKEYFRQCAVAVIDDKAVKSAAYLCHERNTDFGAGEKLQEAGNFALTTDAKAIAEFTGSEDGCLCYDEAYAPFDCADFDGK